MRKGYKREGIVPAVIRFFMGLVFLLIVVGLFYYFVVMSDYSDHIADPNHSFRPYAATQDTLEPTATATPAPVETPEQAATTLPPYATPTPTPEGPTPTPTIAPTPAPTNIAANRLSPPMKRTNAQIPPLSEDIRTGLTRCYVSAVDGYSIMEIEGYAFADSTGFDGGSDDNSAWLIVTRVGAGQNVAYLAEKAEGATGIAHTGAGKNLEGADFRVRIDVSDYADDVYALGLVLLYKDGGKEVYGSYKYEKTLTFVVRSGEVISPINIV